MARHNPPERAKRADRSPNSTPGEGEDKGGTVLFDVFSAKRLEMHYKAAVAANVDTFYFGGRLYVTSYAKYLLEFLKTKLGDWSIAERSEGKGKDDGPR